MERVNLLVVASAQINGLELIAAQVLFLLLKQSISLYKANRPVQVNVSGSDPGFEASGDNTKFAVILTAIRETRSSGDIIYSLSTENANFSIHVCATVRI